MNSTEAAELLGVSKKTLSRYVAAGKLTTSTIVGAPGRQLEFDRDQVEALHASLRSEETGQVEKTGHVVPTSQKRQDVSTAIVPATSNAITPDLLQLVTQNGQDTQKRQDAALSVLTEKLLLPSKILLTLDEAAMVSGVPRGVLNQARKEGQLNARKIGRGFKVHRTDLDAFAKSLFE